LPPEQQTIASPLAADLALYLSASVNRDTTFSELVYSSSGLKLILRIIVNMKNRDVIRWLANAIES
jgi:hypothetical protein